MVLPCKSEIMQQINPFAPVTFNRLEMCPLVMDVPASCT